MGDGGGIGMAWLGRPGCRWCSFFILIRWVLGVRTVYIYITNLSNDRLCYRQQKYTFASHKTLFENTISLKKLTE